MPHGCFSEPKAQKTTGLTLKRPERNPLHNPLGSAAAIRVPFGLAARVRLTCVRTGYDGRLRTGVAHAESWPTAAPDMKRLPETYRPISVGVKFRVAEAGACSGIIGQEIRRFFCRLPNCDHYQACPTCPIYGDSAFGQSPALRHLHQERSRAGVNRPQGTSGARWNEPSLTRSPAMLANAVRSL